MRSLFPLILSVVLLPLPVAAVPSQEHGKGHHKYHGVSVGQGVKTSSGYVIGQSALLEPDVSEYLGIPFAKPPLGDLRFAGPQPFTGTGTINATAFSVSCPANTLTATGGPKGLKYASSTSAELLSIFAQVNATFGEDCLTLNVWTKPQTGERAKAVLFWIYGGGFEFGTTANPIYSGQHFAANEDVVVVSANYRVSVFGFPGLPGMDQNLGLLDQRLAIEWTKNNIAAFGGDPHRITIFGQSAGGSSVEYYSYAWTKDPIVAGFIPESCVETGFSGSLPSNNTEAWFNITQALNCGGPSEGVPATMSCMRTKPYQEISALIPFSGPTDLLGPFPPTVDNKIVFGDYRARAAKGQFIKKPYLIGNTDYEAGLFKVTAALAGAQLSDLAWALFNLAQFSCPVAGAAQRRVQYGVPTWRYRYYGEFPNTRLTLNPSSGAWHLSDLFLIWQTAEECSGAPNTPAETAISRYMQGAWAAFAKDPVNGLSEGPYKWPKYNPKSQSLIRLGYNNETSASYEYPEKYDLACPALAKALRTTFGGVDTLMKQSDSRTLGDFTNLTAMGGGCEVGY